jgi:lipopolysaccharide export system permease protein
MIRRYLTRLLLTRLLGALFGLTALLQLIDLLNRAGTILAHGGLADIGHYLVLRLPTILAEMLPLATLVGALLAFRRLAVTHEATTLRGAGLSLGNVLRFLLPICFIITVVQVVLQAEIAPRAERAFSDWWTMRDSSETTDSARTLLWLKSGRDIAAIAHVSRNGQHLSGIMIAQRSKQGDLLDRLDAESALYENGHWTLHAVRVAHQNHAEAALIPSLIWPDGPVPANMIDLARPVDSMTVDRLIATLRGRWIGAQGMSVYRTQLQGLIVSLFVPFLMILLAVPAFLAPPRASGSSIYVATSLILGLGYLTAAGLLGALGEAGTLPPLAAGWAALVVFAAYGALRLIQAEGDQT